MFHVLLKLQRLLMLSWSCWCQYYWNVTFIFLQERVSSSNSNVVLGVVTVHLESTKLLLLFDWIVLVITQSSLVYFPYMKELWKRYILVKNTELGKLGNLLENPADVCVLSKLFVVYFSLYLLRLECYCNYFML